MAIPLISIVVTNYNYGRFLGRCLDSALTQSHPRTQVIVVDDASSDESRAVVARYAGRVVAVLRERNGGQGAAFNAGFDASAGDMVLFLDADDWLYPHAASRVAAECAAGIAQVQFRLDMVDADGHHIDLLPPPEVAFDDGDVVPLLLSRGRYECTVTSGNAFTRAALCAILPVPEPEFRISADGYLVTVAPLFGRVVSIEEPLGAYALHGGNTWSAAAAVNLAEKLRGCIRHDFRRYEALRRKAAELGLALSPTAGLRDPQHLTNRIGSLLLDPRHHPEPADTRPGLALRGAWATRAARLPRARRVLLSVWFLAVGLLPRSWARRVLSWRVVPSSRPSLFGPALRRIRPWLR